MKVISGADILGLGEKLTLLRQFPAIAYLRGAEAALKSQPPDVATARQSLAQALAILDPQPKPPGDDEAARAGESRGDG